MKYFTVINWNIGGAKFLNLGAEERQHFKQVFTDELAELCRKWQPDVVCMQEAVRYSNPGGQTVELVSPPEGYCYSMTPVLDTAQHLHPVRWKAYKEAGEWPEEAYIGQGNALLWKSDLPHASLWEFNRSASGPGLVTESVLVETGLFTGDRDTEPRATMLAHFVPEAASGQRVDVLLANLHLSTLHGEREGRPAGDAIGVRVRMKQLYTILHGIVSRHEIWSQLLPEDPEPRHRVWVLSGDFNAAPDSEELRTVRDFGFLDLNPAKGPGNKAKGLGADPTHTVDYLLACARGDRIFTEALQTSLAGNPVPDLDFRSSDHFPTISLIPLPDHPVES